MTELLTAKDLQRLLQVDRSTIYRMAEHKRLPAIKVGKQWRFAADQIQNWLQGQTATHTDIMPTGVTNNLASHLPLGCVQSIQDVLAQSMGVMMVTTDLQGNPVTEVSNPCGLFKVISQTPNAIQKCIEKLDTPGCRTGAGTAIHL